MIEVRQISPQAIEINPENPDYYFYRVASFIEQGKYKSIIQDFEKFLESGGGIQRGN